MKKVLFGILYWILSVTWGILMTVPGFLIVLFCMIFLKGTPHRNGYSFIVEVGGNWGGLELGAFAICGRYATEDGPCYSPEWFEHTRRHEFGHSLQNVVLGPFAIFLSFIPSCIHYHRFNARQRAGVEDEDYEKPWYENTATKYGTIAVNWIEGE